MVQLFYLSKNYSSKQLTSVSVGMKMQNMGDKYETVIVTGFRSDQLVQGYVFH